MASDNSGGDLNENEKNGGDDVCIEEEVSRERVRSQGGVNGRGTGSNASDSIASGGKALEEGSATNSNAYREKKSASSRHARVVDSSGNKCGKSRPAHQSGSNSYGNKRRTDSNA